MAEGQGRGRYLSRKEMQTWLREEIAGVLKECDLRVRDATDFAAAYLTGELTAEQAHERLNRYEERWGNPLGGQLASSHPSDETLLESIDSRHKLQRSLDKRRSTPIADADQTGSNIASRGRSR